MESIETNKELETRLADSLAEIERLKAELAKVSIAISRAPKTKDGAILMSNDYVWHPDSFRMEPLRMIESAAEYGGWIVEVIKKTGPDDTYLAIFLEKVSDCYSTCALALASKNETPK